MPVYDGSGAAGQPIGEIAVPDGLAPGESIDVAVPATAPAAGEWLIKADVVVGATRFSELGIAALQLPLTTASQAHPGRTVTVSEGLHSGLLAGKKALIFGVANDHSIAWGIARALHEHGAEIGFSSVESLIERRVKPLADSIGSTFVEPADVQSDEDIARVISKWDEQYGSLDILVHALAFARQEDLEGKFVDTSRDGFAVALDISAYSLVAISHAAQEIMPAGGSIMTLSYYGAEKVVANYNVMGVAKAALEASVRYLANDLGPGGPARQRHQRRPGPDARRQRRGQLQADVRPVPRGGAAAPQHHHRGRGRHCRLPRERPVERRDRRGDLRRRGLQHPRSSDARRVSEPPSPTPPTTSAQPRSAW